MTSLPPVLDAREVVKRYGDFTAVAGVSFEIRPGECYGLLGPNGAGKTTLFKLVTAFARRDGGSLTIFGMDPQRAPSDVKARLGVVGQEDNLYGRRGERATSVQQIEKMVKISSELWRPIATAEQARSIYRIGTFYSSVDETLEKNGWLPNRKPTGVAARQAA